MSRRRDTEDAFAYFTARAGQHGIDVPLSLDAYEEEVGRRAAAEWERRMEDAMRGAYRPPERGTVEVITDPGDMRGFNARPVRG